MCDPRVETELLLFCLLEAAGDSEHLYGSGDWNRGMSIAWFWDQADSMEWGMCVSQTSQEHGMEILFCLFAVFSKRPPQRVGAVLLCSEGSPSPDCSSLLPQRQTSTTCFTSLSLIRVTSLVPGHWLPALSQPSCESWEGETGNEATCEDWSPWSEL